MRISDFPETTTYDDGYMPLDVAGATYKTDVENITPNVANNVSTTSEGYVWAARQGKLLKDRIDENTQGIAESNGVVTRGIVIDSDPWTLYQSRTNNTDVLYYPRTAKEILITVEFNGFVYNAMYVPGAFTQDINLQVAGYYSTTYGHKLAYVPIAYVTRAIGSVVIDGYTSYNDTVTKVYYR